MSTANLYEFQSFKQLETLSKYAWKFQLHLSPLSISSLSISPIPLPLFALSHSFCVFLLLSFSVCFPSTQNLHPSVLICSEHFPCFLHLNHTPSVSFPQPFSHHLTCFLVLPSSTCLPTQHTAQNFIHCYWPSIIVC